MKKESRIEILNLAQSIFEDNDYNVILNLLNSNRINVLRIFISEQLELMEAIYYLDKDNEVLKTQIEFCDKLEDIIMDLFLETT
jgi:hypothetical protein